MVSYVCVGLESCVFFAILKITKLYEEIKMLKADFHVHSEFSNDCSEKIEKQIKRAINLGLEYICFTDHCDMDYPSPEKESEYILDTKSYIEKVNYLKEKYDDKIKVLCGVEIGLMPYLKDRLNAYTNKYNFDFIIGSSHMVRGKDPAIDDFFKGKTEKEAYREYFESILENVKAFNNYNVYGHLDYVVRYGPNKNKYFDFNYYKDVFEEILKIIIQNGNGIEINTSGLRNLGYPHPHKDIIKMYKDLGGEIITVGSDAHLSEYIGYKFDEAEEYLKRLGFHYYTVFENQKLKFYKL